MKTTNKFFILTGLFILMTGMSAFAQDDDAKYATEMLKAGVKAPDFRLPTPDGTQISLSDYQGKYVVLDFWASWCPDCRKDAPTIVKLYEKYKEKEVVFIGVSFDTDKDSWESAIEQYGIKYPQVGELKKWKETTISKEYHINWIPSTYIIDPKGNVVLGTVMTSKLEKKLAELFK